MFQWIGSGRVSDKCFSGFALAGSVTSVSLDLLWCRVSENRISGFVLWGSVKTTSAVVLSPVLPFLPKGPFTCTVPPTQSPFTCTVTLSKFSVHIVTEGLTYFGTVNVNNKVDI